MEKQLILERLQLTIDKLKTLKEEQFNYEEIVTHLDQENLCNSVCCVMGWYPVWFPEHGFQYTKETFFESEFFTINGVQGTDLEDEQEDIQLYHGVSSSIIAILFYGSSLPEHGIYHSMSASLSAVIEVWERVLALLANDELDPNY